MEIKKIKVNNPGGIHLRVAARIVQVAKQFKSKVYLARNSKVADSGSILDIFGLVTKRGDEIALIAEGEDEEVALKQVADLFEDGAGI
jgi:phosphocarrier protein HPr